jgi:hypothetical protein
MPLSLAAGTGDAIDSQIWEIYKQRLGGGELRQLAKLFKNAGLLARLENILLPTLTAPSVGYRESWRSASRGSTNAPWPSSKAVRDVSNWGTPAL